MARTKYSIYVLLTLATVIGKLAHAKEMTIHNCSANEIRVCLYNTSERVIFTPYYSDHISSGASHSFSCQPDTHANHCASILLVKDKSRCDSGYFYRNLGKVDHYFYNDSISRTAPAKCP